MKEIDDIKELENDMEQKIHHQDILLEQSIFDENNPIDEEKDKISLIGDFVRFRSSEYKLTNAEDFFEDPISLEVEDVLHNIDSLKEREEYRDIYTIKGSEAIYLFSDKYITKNYAEMMVRVEEKDLMKLIVETVRHESKTYPRPTSVKLFSYNPFKLTKDQFNEVLTQLKTKEEYGDINEVRVSNGALYLYSDKYMLKAHADSLAEWIEIGQRQNP